jgi:hypothetical protein
MVMPMPRYVRPCTAALGLALALPVAAQSTSGSIVGEARAGDTVVISRGDTGFKREIKLKHDGKFQARQLPSGDYQVILVHADGAIEPVQFVDVRAGGSSRVTLQRSADDGSAAGTPAASPR